MDIAVNKRESNYLKQYLSERKWALGFAIFIMVVTTVPYFWGYCAENREIQNSWRFTGFIFGVEDGNSYIAKALTGMAGAWLFRTPYTAIQQKGVIAFLPYLLFGKLAAPPGTHEQLVALFQLFRFFAGVLMVLATYDFIKYFVNDERMSRYGTVIAIIGGGIGWLLLLFGKSTILGSLPLEFYSPEAFGFLSLYGIPHLAMARALLLWGLLCHFKLSSSINIARYLEPVFIGLIWLLVALLQPLTAMVMGMVLAIYPVIVIIQNTKTIKPLQILNKNKIRNQLKIFLLELLPPLPFFIYYFISATTDEFLKAWSAQNIISSPHPLHYLLAYFLLLPFSFVGIYISLKNKQTQYYVLFCWLILSFVLAYSPLTIQRRLIDGIWVVLVIFMLEGYRWVRNVHPKQIFGYYLPIISMLVTPSALILLVGGVITAAHPAEPVFLPAAEIGAFEFINSYAQSGDIVIAAYDTGNALPAWAPVRVLLGHGPESADFDYFKQLIDRFYNRNWNDSDRLEIIDKFRIRFVFWGPKEQRLGDWNPAEAAWLTKVFDYDGYTVYEVLYP